MSERAKLKTVARIWKFSDSDLQVYALLRSGARVEDVVKLYSDRLAEHREVHGNIFLAEGANYIWRLVMGEAGLVPFGANTCIGIGDGTAPADPSQSGLTGVNKYYKTVDSGYPRVEGNAFIVRTTFGGDEANFEWREWTVANGCGDEYININRKVEDLGRKAPGSTWVLELTLTIS